MADALADAPVVVARGNATGGELTDDAGAVLGSVRTVPKGGGGRALAGLGFAARLAVALASGGQSGGREPDRRFEVLGGDGEVVLLLDIDWRVRVEEGSGRWVGDVVNDSSERSSKLEINLALPDEAMRAKRWGVLRAEDVAQLDPPRAAAELDHTLRARDGTVLAHLTGRPGERLRLERRAGGGRDLRLLMLAFAAASVRPGWLALRPGVPSGG